MSGDISLILALSAGPRPQYSPSQSELAVKLCHYSLTLAFEERIRLCLQASLTPGQMRFQPVMQ